MSDYDGADCEAMDHFLALVGAAFIGLAVVGAVVVTHRLVTWLR